MALIIEDGSQVSNSDSYTTRAEYITYAGNLGVTIVDEDATDEKLRKAAKYIEAQEARLMGVKVARDQSMPYPRTGLVIENFSWASDEIPRQVILCQMSFALDLEAGIDIYNPPQSDSAPVKSEEVSGAVKVEYAISETSKLSRQSSSLALLACLMENNGLSITLVKT